MRINQIRFVDIDSEQFVVKRRARWCWLPIQIGNLVFRFRHPPVEVLNNYRWIEWESIVQQAHFGQTIKILGREITEKRFSGSVLSELLNNPNHALQQKLEWLQSGAAALNQFHQTRIEWQGKGVALSHGDASVCNVVIDPHTGQVRWFDFDLRHDLTVPENERRADDLRAYLFTAMACGAMEPEQILLAIKQGYAALQIWQCLLRQISAARFSWDSFHRAQIERTGKQIGSSPSMPASVEAIQELLRGTTGEGWQNFDDQNGRMFCENLIA